MRILTFILVAVAFIAAVRAGFINQPLLVKAVRTFMKADSPSSNNPPPLMGLNPGLEHTKQAPQVSNDPLLEMPNHDGQPASAVLPEPTVTAVAPDEPAATTATPTPEELVKKLDHLLRSIGGESTGGKS